MARTLKSYYLVKRRDRLTDGRPTYYLRVRDTDGQLPPGSGGEHRMHFQGRR